MGQVAHQVISGDLIDPIGRVIQEPENIHLRGSMLRSRLVDHAKKISPGGTTLSRELDYHHLECQPSGMGATVSEKKNPRPLEPITQTIKLFETQGSHSCATDFSGRSSGSMGQDATRQQDRSSLPHSPRGDKESNASSPFCIHLCLDREAASGSDSNIPSRKPESTGGSAKQTFPWTQWVVTTTEVPQDNFQKGRHAHDQHNVDLSKCSASSVSGEIQMRRGSSTGSPFWSTVLFSMMYIFPPVPLLIKVLFKIRAHKVYTVLVADELHRSLLHCHRQQH